MTQKATSEYRLPEEAFELGWTDLNLVKHAERLNSISSLFVTHLDLLDELDEIKVCTAYTQKIPPTEDGKEATIERIKGRLPASIHEFGKWEAEFEKIPGWKKSTKKVKRFDDLPDDAQSLIKLIEQKLKK